MPYAGFDQDKHYLTEKFRHPVFPADSGVDNETLFNSICAFAESLGDLPYPVIKARCFEHVCREIQIDTDPHDRFPAFGCWNRNRRTLGPLLWKRMAEVNARHHQASQPVVDARNRAGLQMMWKDFDHSVPDWEAVLTLGFPGLRDRARRYRAEREAAGRLDDDARNYFDGLDITVCAVIDCIGRIIDYAASHYAGNPRIEAEIACLDQLRRGAPRNTYEVLQIMYLHFIFCEHIDHMQVRSLGNFDAMVHPYWKRDIDEGRYTEEQLREYLACFLMQWGSINNYWGQPVYLGGTKADGSTEINELSWTFLDVYGKLDITTPKIQIKTARNTPKPFIDKALDMIRRGRSSIVFVSEEGIRDAMMGMGWTAEEARTCDISGCYEFSPRAASNGTCTAHVNLLKPVELVFNNGSDPATGYAVECGAPKLEDIRTFDAFYAAYLKYLKNLVDVCRDLSVDQEKYLQEINPGQLFSITVKHSLETATDAFSRGSVYNIADILLVGIGTAVDALMAVKKFVFETHELTLEQFRAVLAANWQGSEKLRLRALRSREKYGNGLPGVDFYARAILHFCASRINLRPNGRGGCFFASGHSAKQYFDLGLRTGATPDGRRAGEEMSKNLSPTMGMDTNGVTALIRSVTSINSQDLPGDFPLDVMMHPATVQGEEGLAAMHSLIRTYMDRGGIAIHFNVVDASTLEEAQKHPENYESLQIRVCGWNVRFNDMAKVEQDAYIERARNIAE